MADFDQFSAEPSHDSYDNDFERLGDDSEKIAGENPEEDLYSADPSQVPTGELLTFGDSAPAETEPTHTGFDAGFGNPIPEAVPDSTTGFDADPEPSPPADPWVQEPVAEPAPFTAPAEDPLGLVSPEPEPTPPKEHEPTPTPPSSPALGRYFLAYKTNCNVSFLMHS